MSQAAFRVFFLCAGKSIGHDGGIIGSRFFF